MVTAALDASPARIRQCLEPNFAEPAERVYDAIMEERKLYPVEYATPVPIVFDGVENSIVGSHSLFPDVLFHAFSTLGALMSPELPLRREQHEMIATMVSVTNRCFY